ncbi:MAG: carbohydrate ABC transporter permease [Lachnospiraceae bacterium]|nr:carbohydrate ABC transporter permease [Lachnospiraceae bacterium]
MTRKFSAVDYILAGVFVIVIIVTLYPFLNVLAISFNDATDTIKNINFVIPRMFTLSNYKYVFKDSDFVMPFVTSVSRTVVGTIIGVFTTSMLAYTLSRKDFVFHKFFTMLFVVTMYVGGGLIPEYLLIMRTLHLGNNFLVYIIPGIRNSRRFAHKVQIKRI